MEIRTSETMHVGITISYDGNEDRYFLVYGFPDVTSLSEIVHTGTTGRSVDDVLRSALEDERDIIGLTDDDKLPEYELSVDNSVTDKLGSEMVVRLTEMVDRRNQERLAIVGK